MGRLNVEERIINGRLSQTGPSFRSELSVHRFAEFKCECGNIKQIRCCDVRSGRSKSCGCLNAERIREVKHGCRTHAETSGEYISWASMKTRCLNASCAAYKNYGGRGITIDESWKQFENFLRDMGSRPEGTSLDRIDNNSGYNKTNCRWATDTQQARNKRTSVVVEFNGSKYTISELCENYAIGRKTLQHRLKIGWSVKRAVETPIRKKSDVT